MDRSGQGRDNRRAEWAKGLTLPEVSLLRHARLPLGVQLHHILVVQHMLAAHGLAVEDAGAPDAG